ncbi:hypothetical protein LBMAG47_03460 [Planctomycetia bacterium]|jgi:hypothetical protein|nr:hypothetical protein LBMAG47_03460 [Planctomycetia bacterium]
MRRSGFRPAAHEDSDPARGRKRPRQGCRLLRRTADGAGEYFIACLAAVIEALKIHAGVHERQHGLLRALSKRFPFGIFYELTGTTIEIFAVLDWRQDPEAIESRLRGYE